MARIYSNIHRDFGSIWIGAERLPRIVDVKLKNTGGIFGRYLEVTHGNGTTSTIKQVDRRCFFIDGSIYDGECDGFTDGLRLLNNA